MRIDEILEAASVIPVVEIAALENAAPLARSLSAGGLRVVELTLRTACALDALKAMQDAVPDLMVGMGTVRTVVDVNASVKAGAAFLVSPGASVSLLKALSDSGAPSLPGVATASEAIGASEFGFKAMKFFPAEFAGGISYLKSLAGPLPDIAFCPSGGISAEKAREYLALSNVACVGGSWIATRKMIAENDWVAIEKNASCAATIV